jgi:hypothetical protein
MGHYKKAIDVNKQEVELSYSIGGLVIFSIKYPQRKDK